MPNSIYDLQFQQPRSNFLGSQLKEVIDFIEFIDSNPRARNIIINLKNIQFVQPTFILALAVLFDMLEERGSSLIVNQPKDGYCNSYLKYINFPSGIRPDVIKDWERLLNKHPYRTYLPIVNFPTDRDEISTNVREKLLSQINLIIKSRLNIESELQNAVSYLISEITDNIIEHSGINRGWLMVQFYPTTHYLDICLIDAGKTILGSYIDNGMLEIKDDATAIEKALIGLSTKRDDRGTGLRTSRAISMDGLEGDFILYSGNALYFKNKIAILQRKWPGTLVAMRIKSKIEKFDIYSYI